MQSQKILIVDDDPINRTLLRHMLMEQGYGECFEAEDGQSAIDLAQQCNPDIVLLDIVMPGMDGFDVAKYLKARAATYLPIIFITASDDRSKLIKCLDVGGDDFALKPFDKFILSAKIKAHLRIRTMAQQIAMQNLELSNYRIGVDREHAIIEHIYKHALQNPAPAMSFFDINQTPADNFSGDLFLTQPHPSGGIYLLLGDFTGHGLASTIGAIPVSRSFASMTADGMSVVEIATELNSLLITILPPDRFFSAIVCHINESGERAIVWHGGLPDVYLKREDTGNVESFCAKHMALGILQPDEFETDCTVIDLELGDSLYLSSDGIIEATPIVDGVDSLSIQDMLGEDTLRAWIGEGDDISVTDIVNKAKSTLSRTQFDDDVTLIKFTSKDLSVLRKNQVLTRLPFSFSTALGPNEFRGEGCVEQILQVIASQQGMASIRSDIFTVLSEMYTNALDHGVLNLDSKLKESPEGFMEYYTLRQQRLNDLTEGFIKIEINLYPSENSVAISVTDSGKGFDYQSVSVVHDYASSGRGLLLLSEICDSVWFEGNGNRIVVELSV